MAHTLTPTPAAAVGYTRVSTRRQADHGTSLVTQPEQIRAYCSQHGLVLTEIHTDAGRSGKCAKHRPGLQAAMAQVLATGGTLVVPSLSRFGRSIADVVTLTQQLTRAGARLVSIKESIDTGTSAGRLMANVFAALAEFERERILENITDTLQTKRERGEKLGGHVPLGYQAVRHDGGKLRLVADPAEQRVVSRITTMRAAGLGYHTIAATLTADGVQTKRGGRWNPKTVRDVCLRQRPAVQMA